MPNKHLNFCSRREALQVVGSLFSVYITGCSAPGATQSVENENIQPNEYIYKESPTSLQDLSYENWPQPSSSEMYTLDEAEELEAQTHSVNGNSGLHPVQTSRLLLRLSENIRQSEELAFAEAADRVTAEMIDSAIVDENNSLYYPYTFDFQIHGSPNWQLTSPWYSGMAQGIALSAFSRLYYQTGNEYYLDLSHRTFQTLVPAVEITDNTWVSGIFDDLYWIEEYPTFPPAHTLNGKIFAMYGLYEYWRTTGSQASKHWLQAAISTIDKTIENFRAQGEPSYYCLEHDVQSQPYHETHIRQLRKLSDMTGSNRFSNVASNFESDSARN